MKTANQKALHQGYKFMKSVVGGGGQRPNVQHHVSIHGRDVGTSEKVRGQRNFDLVLSGPPPIEIHRDDTPMLKHLIS